MIPAPYFGLGQTGELSLWCRNYGQHDGGTKFWVINGHWDGYYKDGHFYITDVNYQGPHGEAYPCEILWMGEVPFADEDYNEAMATIRRLGWTMTDKKLTLEEVLDQKAIIARNSNIFNLADIQTAIMTRYNEIEKEMERLNSWQADVERLKEAPDGEEIGKLHIAVRGKYHL